jgi:uncharacterized membrane protein
MMVLASAPIKGNGAALIVPGVFLLLLGAVLYWLSTSRAVLETGPPHEKERKTALKWVGYGMAAMGVVPIVFGTILAVTARRGPVS